MVGSEDSTHPTHLHCQSFPTTSTIKDDPMSVSEESHPYRSRSWLWTLLIFGLILGSAALRLAYLAYDCPLDLAPDEAHYWDWSRHLDWSYYSKGPLVAYLIRAATLLAGDAQTANLMMVVRLPAVLCGSLLLLSLYVLTIQVYRNATLALEVI